MPEAREGEGVRADAAAQIGDRAEAGAREASRVLGGHLQPCRLLESVRGEQHPRGELVELGTRPGAQPRLGEHGGHQVRRMAGGAQPGHDPHDVGVRRDVAHLVEQPQPLGRQQGAQLLRRHPHTVSRLAVGLNEC